MTNVSRLDNVVADINIDTVLVGDDSDSLSEDGLEDSDPDENLGISGNLPPVPRIGSAWEERIAFIGMYSFHKNGLIMQLTQTCNIF